MTFSILAVCPETGEAGYAQATSTPAVADRCTAVVHGRGVITLQSRGDYKRLQLGIKMLELGYGPDKVLADLRVDEFSEYKQIAIIDMVGKMAFKTGSVASPWAGEVIGKNHIATGNTLVGPQVVEAMSKAFMASEGETFAERLLRALEAGRDAGGQPDGQMSSAVKVFNNRQLLVNLRVDVHPEPVGHLRTIYEWYKHLLPYYLRQGLDPTAFTGDTWWAFEQSGAPLIPDVAHGWTAADIEKRAEQVRRATTTKAGKGA